MDSLKFEQIDSRHANIKAAYSQTCQWLLEHPDYKHWLDPSKFDQNHGFLWISGKPGSGKSTLMKYALAKAQRKTADTAATISFFFNARGDTLENKVTGMYRTLLCQLLEKLPDLQEVLDDTHLPTQNQNGSVVWAEETLKTIFSSAVARLNQRRVMCFVDALDECDENQVRAMVDFFETLGDDATRNGIRFYVCFSSRHYPYVTIRHGRRLVLEEQSGHDQDLEIYVHDRLKIGQFSFPEDVRNRILQKAAGVFMWIVLVVDILNKEFDRGRMFGVRNRLEEIPDKLSELFKDMLRRDTENMAELLLCIQWILYAKRPLKREEFYFAVVSGVFPESLAAWNPDIDHIKPEVMGRYVVSSSKGLAEVTNPGKSKDQTVQFIHESVRDFLIKDHGLHDLWQELGEDFQSSSHDRLKKCCLSYLETDISLPDNASLASVALPRANSEAAKAMRQQVSERFPFLEYAVRQVLYHANEAAVGLQQSTFLEEFPLKTWINLDNLFEKYQIRRHTPTASFLYLLAEKNWARLIRTQLQCDPRIDIPGERYGHPLFAAIENGHQDAVKEMLQQNAHPFPSFDITTLRDRARRTPVLLAVQKGHEAIVKLLLDTDSVDIDTKDIFHRSPLLLAVERGHEAIVKLLLNTYKVNTEVKNYSGITSLLWAAMHEHPATVKLLLNIGRADFEAKDHFGMTSLLLAAMRGHQATVEVLLNTGRVDINAKDYGGMTALSWAASYGYRAIVELLLNTGKVDIDAKDQLGRTPLALAVQNGRKAVVELLLNTRKVDIRVRDDFGRTPLSWAEQYENEAIVELLSGVYR